MKYKSLTIGDKVYKNQKDIEKRLENQNFYWVIDAEFENAELEIKHDTLVWESGKWFHGKWEYGIFNNGEFHGTWENGIFEGGTFKGNWISGIDYTEKIN
tara:strand:+ start:15775 stop:16074 length:300 start_codon:yes stop_codon:yes gene_type:complete